ncbi:MULTISPECIES: hypothetical protein [Vibrio]|uniref:hypothetical protein n=1 Tax=Vibrio TaxID=662 RepID=UPI000BB471AB|nr:MULTISPECIES: hypothetical protein [Vibrio]ATC57641.1 hypothetical protein CMV05_08475 [Vibrio anguillarum]MBF4251833.1 hypothetical protein [Vibrio anguillarum]MBF4387070.1 hypothetical protein [Vibrio anguillarum]MBF4404208.1 hypothetical protein [Vibrio anguillarum]PRQ63524.1 hypothetical protein BWR16_04730 [Vibrio sp. V01_P9A10T6]
MKASELKHILDSLPDNTDPELVMGEAWLPERLIDTQLDGHFLFLEFDNAPEEGEGEEEGRGFVEHEIAMIRRRFEEILLEKADNKSKADAMLALFLMGHEYSSSEVIEILEDPSVPQDPNDFYHENDEDEDESHDI